MDFYKLIANNYDELYGGEQQLKLEIIKQNVEVRGDDVLLDVGCGTGLSSGFECGVVGIDPQIELLELNENANKICGKGETLPFKDSAFDIVVAVTSVHNFHDAKRGLEEMKRVGKKDFAFSILKKAKKSGEIEKCILKNFRVRKIVDGKKDWIFICTMK